jgi:hypothetical protein
MAYYGSINNNYNVRALRSEDLSNLASLISYSKQEFYGVASNGSFATASNLLADAGTSKIYDFALVHRRRGLIAYKQFVYDTSSSSDCLVLRINLEKNGNKNRIGNRIENWIRDDVSEFSNIEKIYFQSPSRATASSSLATRWVGKTKTQITQTRNSTSSSLVASPHYSVLIDL